MCETLPRCLRRDGSACWPATWPIWRSATRNGGIPSPCSAMRRRGWSGSPTATARSPARRTSACWSVRCACWGRRRSGSPDAGSGRSWPPPRPPGQRWAEPHWRAPACRWPGCWSATTSRLPDGCCPRCADATPTGWIARAWRVRRWNRSRRTPPTRRSRRCCGPRSAVCPRCSATAASTRWTR